MECVTNRFVKPVGRNRKSIINIQEFNTLKHLFFVLVIVLNSCDEQRRVIEPFIPAGDRVVLLEEFTGKGCNNCPKGSREIENLLTVFPDNLVAVSIHAGFFANPQTFPIGQYDFRTIEGEFLYDYLGPIIGYPSGTVNRTPFNNEMQLSSNAWASAITKEIQKPPSIELNIDRAYNSATRELMITINGIGKETLTGNINLSIMITESGIVDAQDDIEAGGIVPDYVHKHVLRDMLTPATGVMISNGIIPGQTFSNSFSSVLDNILDPHQMEIVAFISMVEGNNFPVMQAASVPIIP